MRSNNQDSKEICNEEVLINFLPRALENVQVYKRSLLSSVTPSPLYLLQAIHSAVLKHCSAKCCEHTVLMQET